MKHKIPDSQVIVEMTEVFDAVTGESLYVPCSEVQEISFEKEGLSMIKEDGSRSGRMAGAAIQGRMAGFQEQGNAKKEDPWADLNDFFSRAENGVPPAGMELELLPGGALRVAESGSLDPGRKIGHVAQGRMAK